MLKFFSPFSHQSNEPVIVEKDLKIVLVGGERVGKTCLVRMYQKGRFKTRYTPTIGIDIIKVRRSEVYLRFFSNNTFVEVFSGFFSPKVFFFFFEKQKFVQPLYVFFRKRWCEAVYQILGCFSWRIKWSPTATHFQQSSWCFFLYRPYHLFVRWFSSFFFLFFFAQKQNFDHADSILGFFFDIKADKKLGRNFKRELFLRFEKQSGNQSSN